MKGIIYCIENLQNSKKYIGQHIGDINDDYWGSGVAIKKAIKKYGKKSFKKYQLEECLVEELNKREKYWIKKYNTFLGEGYNRDDGGGSNSGYWKNLSEEDKEKIHKKRLKNRPKNFKDICKKAALNRDFTYLTRTLKGRKYSKKTKEKMSKSHLGKKHSKETIEKMKNRIISDKTKLKISKSNTGKKRTPEQCNNISKGTLGKKKSFRTEQHKRKLRKPIIQLDLEGNFIKLWEAVSFAGKELGIDYTGISNCANGKLKTSGGFKWKWK